MSSVGGLVLIAGVGAGVYSSALEEKHMELQKNMEKQLEEFFDKETAEDFAVPVVEKPAKAVCFVSGINFFLPKIHFLIKHSQMQNYRLKSKKSSKRQ